ncbi:hypothetical protein, partial [Rhizobium aethiopicum]|uniref:hypothetical protein n=1 Tax=Rhizobium aethiopicum TaxID=1138170 RepID=UPI001AEDBAF3
LSKDPISQIPQAPPPTFLFLLIFNCQRTDDTGRHQNPFQTRAQNTNQQSPIRLSFFRTKDFVASSAAALVQ